MAAAGSDTKAARPDFEAAGLDFEGARPDFGPVGQGRCVCCKVFLN